MRFAAPLATLGLALSLGACAPSAEDAFGTSDDALGSADVSKTTACFTTARLGASIDVTGSVFEVGARTADKPVVLLLHGMASQRDVWDGGPNAPATAPSFARTLAKKGYVVVTIDRPGYGESPYRPVIPIGNGFQLTPNAQIDMLHDVVEQIHAGRYRTPVDGAACSSGPIAPTGSKTVVLGGVSLSGGLVEGYAAKYDDVAAIAPMGFANQGMSKFLLGLFVRNQLVTQLSRRGYVPYYRRSADGVSDECVESSLYEPGMDPEVTNRFCKNENLVDSPAGELDFSLFLQQSNKSAVREKKLAKVPVFLVFGDHDRDFPGAFAADHGEKDLQRAEIAMWKTDCGCDVTPYIQKDAGHINVLQKTMPDLANAFDAWLRARSLGGKL